MVADDRKISKIQTLKLNRVIGYVHKSPNPNSKVLFPCHIRAFYALQKSNPEIVIEECLFNKENVEEKKKVKVPCSVEKGTSEKYAGQQSGASCIINHARPSSVPSSY